MSRATSYREGGIPILSFVRWPQGISESFSRATKRTTSATCSVEAGFATAEGVIASTTYSEQTEGSAETCEAPMADSRRDAKLEIALAMGEANWGERHHVALGGGSDGARERRRISPQPLLSGKILPGLSKQAGLKASWTRRMRSKSASEKRSGISSAFSMPMPCSPVSAPPTSTQ